MNQRFDDSAERAVLATAILVPDKWDEATSVLDEGKFYSPNTRAVFRALSALRADGVPFDAVTIANVLRKQGVWGKQVEPSWFADLLGATPAVANVAAHAQIVHDCWRVRQLHEISSQAAAETSLVGSVDVNAAVEGLSRRIEALSAPTTADTMSDLGSCIHESFSAIQQAMQSGEARRGATVGLRSLDHATGGMVRGRVYVLAARSGMGKTTMAAQIAMQQAIAGLPVLYFSLEMSRQEISNRVLFCHAGIDRSKLRAKPRSDGFLTQLDWSALANSCGILKRAPMLIDDAVGLTVPQMRAKIGQAQAYFAKQGKRLCTVVIDHALKMRGANPKQIRREQIVEITGGIKDFAKSLDVAVLELTQMNRSSESRQTKDHRPRISDLKESGSFEEDADQVWFLYRPDKYNPDKSKHTNEAEFILAKVRDDGQEGIVRLHFDGPAGRFLEHSAGAVPEDFND